MLIRLLKLAAFAFPVMIVIDFLWIGFIARGFYAAELGALLSPTVVWPAALLFYVLYAPALAFFVIRPALDTGTLKDALLWGAFFGLTAYGTYDLTNLATLPTWPLTLTIVDIAWGAFCSAIAAAASFTLGKRFAR